MNHPTPTTYMMTHATNMLGMWPKDNNNSLNPTHTMTTLIAIDYGENPDLCKKLAKDNNNSLHTTLTMAIPLVTDYGENAALCKEFSLRPNPLANPLV